MMDNQAVRVGRDGEFPVIEVTGNLTIGQRVREFRGQYEEIFRAGRPAAVFLDFSGLKEIDSAGLGELVVLYTTAGEQACRLCVLSPPGNFVRMLAVTRLDGILRCFESRADARRWISGQA